MHVVAESGVAAHWLYKASEPRRRGQRSPGHQVAAVAAGHPARDARRRGVLGPRQDRPVPRRRLRVHAQEPDHGAAARRDGGRLRLCDPQQHRRPHRGRAASTALQVPLRTELKNGDVVEVVTAPVSTPNPAWLGFVRTGRARSKIRHHLKSLAQAESQELGEKLLTQALRAEGLEKLPADDEEHHAIWEKLLRFTGNRSRAELLTDIGLGKRIASIVAKRLMTHAGRTRREARCPADQPRALHRARERVAGRSHAGRQRERLGAVCRSAAGRCRAMRSSATWAAARAWWCTPRTARVAKRLQHKDSERFIGVEWADEPVRPFETGVLVTVRNGKGVLARVAAALAERRSRHHARGHGRRDAAGRDRPALRGRGARPHPSRRRAAGGAAHPVGARGGPHGARALRPAASKTPPDQRRQRVARMARPSLPALAWSAAAKSFHWGIAALILLQFVLGWLAASWRLSPTKLDLFVWHKSLGMLILALVVLRLLNRLAARAPALPRRHAGLGTGGRACQPCAALRPDAGLAAERLDRQCRRRRPVPHLLAAAAAGHRRARPADRRACRGSPLRARHRPGRAAGAAHRRRVAPPLREARRRAGPDASTRTPRI